MIQATTRLGEFQLQFLTLRLSNRTAFIQNSSYIRIVSTRLTDDNLRFDDLQESGTAAVTRAGRNVFYVWKQEE